MYVLVFGISSPPCCLLQEELTPCYAKMNGATVIIQAVQNRDCCSTEVLMGDTQLHEGQQWDMYVTTKALENKRMHATKFSIFFGHSFQGTFIKPA